MANTTNYAQPYISVQIFDNTEFAEEEEVSVERKDFNGMQVGFFSGGRDNQLLYMQSRSSYLKECNKPNFKKDGQAAYNVDNALATGNCGMYIMNLRPENATHANVVIMVRFKVVEETPAQTDTQEIGEETGTTTKKLVYSFYAKTIENAKTAEELLTAATALMETDPDENGYYNMPFALFYALGRGEFGNNIHLAFSNTTEYPDEFDNEYGSTTTYPKYHVYTLTVAEPVKDGLLIKDVFYGNFDEDGFDTEFIYGPATFFSDTINNIEFGSQRINTEIYAPTMSTICALYNQTFTPEVEKTPASLDLLTCLSLDGTPDGNLQLDDTATDYLNLFSLDGFTMQSGNDGWDGMDATAIDEEKEALLIKAYSGELDPLILSRFSSPCDFNLDANYPISVKKQMAALANRRLYDCMTYLDTRLSSTSSGMISILKDMKNIYGFNVIKEGHNYKWRDEIYTGKVCHMSITHWLAKALPDHMGDPERNLLTPMAKDVAVLNSGTDYIPGSFKPVIDPDNNDVKNIIYRLRGNFYETVTYNSVQRSTAITSCQTNSDRLLEMNEYILQRAVRIVYSLLASRQYKLGESNDRSAFSSTATKVVNDELSKYLRSASVELEMTSVDEKKSLLRIKLHMTYKTIIQNGEVEIYLDPRVTDTVEVA